VAAVPIPNAFGNTIFCDDIRNEEGGKSTYVGIYHSVMYVPSPFPAVLPKFGMAISYIEKVGACSGPAKINIFFPGDAEDVPTLSFDVPIEKARSGPLPPLDPDFPRDEPIWRAYMPLLLSPFVLKQRGIIKVRALVGGDVIKLGALRVDHTPSDNSP